MPQQSALTIVADVRPGETENLKQVLASMGDGVANEAVIDFGALSGVHFARFLLLEETADLRGEPLLASLVYLSDFDVSAGAHLQELAQFPGIDRLFGHCDGYLRGPPTVDDRRAYLRTHRIKEQAVYVNRPGRTLQRIRQEAELRDALERFLDARTPDGDAPEVRAEVQRLVEAEPSLGWARDPPEGPSFLERVRNAAHLVGLPLLLLLSPLLLPFLPVFAVLLRRHERSDPAPHLKPDDRTVQELAALEDHLVQNPFTAIGFVKPGS